MNTTTATNSNPAEVYDRFFVPALFAQWGPRVAAAAQIAPGDHALDVGCGTGVLALAVAERALPAGRVVGLDASEEMLGVARRKSSAIEWVPGKAESLPFEDASFDAVLSQVALMLFEQPVGALRQMWRMLRPGGRLVVAVPDRLENSPGYLALTELLQRLFGSDIADRMRPPFALGDEPRLRGLFVDAGIGEVAITTEHGPVRFDSIDAMISTERACVWTLGGLLDAEQFERLRRRARQDLSAFAATDGRVEFDMPMHVVTACRP
ncbi:MAG: methyltransferase domain-containing protein [Acidobacteria bacterium]|nr:methyltransferase domain-containing protein [Acidobacteriota bacterium]